MNNDVREKFIIRTKIINYIRKFLNNLGFLEVETPMMTFTASGATAKPFVTHHADFKRDIFMRIAPELYLKQLVIGGLDRVYEIGRQFRNESIDTTHNPEFTSCEFYMAYNDMYDLMNITENLLSNMVKEIIGKSVIKCQRKNNNKREEYNKGGNDKDDNDDKEIEIDFTPPFKRLDVINYLEQILDIKFPLPHEWGTEATNEFLENICIKHHVNCNPPRTNSRLLEKVSYNITYTVNPL
ncbi:hypothetical protein Glove_66g3 [Diversispora epigaea]|uniref:Aminoacyl-transfer RNA synthetases class-II family profile domain-containing protein n=1 Tax=Diversispora epigaea TaxID=1348612 RepID=A0A397JAK3_9GLOM|nr:hypothetical protein Glove_66g3 [Diversispora epigaea]